MRAPAAPRRRPKYLTGAQKKSTEGRPTGDLQSPLKIEVRSALRAPPDERPAGAPQMLCAPPPRGGGGGDRYATVISPDCNPDVRTPGAMI